MRRRMYRRIRCAPWRGCGEADDEGNLHTLVARAAALCALAGADRGLVWPATDVPDCARIWVGPRFSESGRGKLFAVRSSGRDCDDDSFQLGVLRNRAVVGPAVRIPEREIG